MKAYLQEKLDWFLDYYQKNVEPARIYRASLLGAADVNSPAVRNLKETAFEEHMMPEDLMDGATVIIAYFLAFTRELGDGNAARGGNLPSEEWAYAYDYTFRITDAIREFLIGEIEKLGYRAMSPEGVFMSEEALKSNWSHRHLAYAAGLGTFGINNMLITELGCCGRYDTFLSDIPIETGSPVEEEYCPYKRDRSCRVCVDNCFTGALTTESFDRFRCYELLKKNDPIVGQEVCGKCTTGIPCAYEIPKRRNLR